MIKWKRLELVGPEDKWKNWGKIGHKKIDKPILNNNLLIQGINPVPYDASSGLVPVRSGAGAAAGLFDSVDAVIRSPIVVPPQTIDVAGVRTTFRPPSLVETTPPVLHGTG